VPANHLQRVYIDVMARLIDEDPSGKGRRFSLRVEDRDREPVDRAADVNPEARTQFLVFGGRERGGRLLSDRPRFQLSPDNWDKLVVIMDR
jgi:uncharacterized protein (DUF1778 family)